MDPTQEIALASVITTGVLGLAGMLSTAVVARQGRKHASELAVGEREHSLTIGRVERAQQRRADVYVAVLRQVNGIEVALRADPTGLDWRRESDLENGHQALRKAQDAAARMVSADDDEFAAKLWAYASDNVRNSYWGWGQACRDLLGVIMELLAARIDDPTPDLPAELLQRRNEAVSRERMARDDLRTLIRRELAA